MENSFHQEGEQINFLNKEDSYTTGGKRFLSQYMEKWCAELVTWRASDSSVMMRPRVWVARWLKKWRGKGVNVLDCRLDADAASRGGWATGLHLLHPPVLR